MSYRRLGSGASVGNFFKGPTPGESEFFAGYTVNMWKILATIWSECCEIPWVLWCQAQYTTVAPLSQGKSRQLEFIPPFPYTSNLHTVKKKKKHIHTHAHPNTRMYTSLIHRGSRQAWSWSWILSEVTASHTSVFGSPQVAGLWGEMSTAPLQSPDLDWLSLSPGLWASAAAVLLLRLTEHPPLLQGTGALCGCVCISVHHMCALVCACVCDLVEPTLKSQRARGKRAMCQVWLELRVASEYAWH